MEGGSASLGKPDDGIRPLCTLHRGLVKRRGLTSQGAAAVCVGVALLASGTYGTTGNCTSEVVNSRLFR